MDKTVRRNRRKKSIRKKVFGTSERPRMCANKSSRNLSVQIIDDIEGKTICSVSTNALESKGKGAASTRKNMNFAQKVGEQIAKKAVEKGIKKVVFDRSGYRYHGVIKAISDAARKGGLEF